MNFTPHSISVFALVTFLTACTGEIESTESTEAPTVSAPVISPDGGTHTDTATVTLSTSTQGADIYYTTDGSNPAATDTLYTSPFLLTNSATVKARAFKKTYTPSTMASATFSINQQPIIVSTPVFNPDGGTHNASVMVNLSTTTPNATIYYTTNGDEPTQNSTLYSVPFILTDTTTVKAKAFRSGDTASNTATATFTINKPVTDIIAPVVSAPNNITSEATGANTMVNLGTGTATDETDGMLTPTNNAPAAGFPVGETQVSWTAQDNAGNTGQDIQLVTITDTTTPQLQAPNDVTAVAQGSSTVVNLGNAIASDIVDGNITATNNAPIDGFSIGLTTVTWTAIDNAGNTSTAQQKVTINAVNCSTLETDYVAQTYPVLQTNCQGCHSSANRQFKVTGTAATDFDSFQSYVTLTDSSNTPLVISKALGVNHSGGARITTGSTEHIALSDMADKLSVCITDTNNPQGLELSTGYERLHKITMSLAARAPTQSEELMIASAANDTEREQAFNGIIDALMNQETFITRIREIYNDMLLTQHLLTDVSSATNTLMSDSPAPDRKIFTDPNKGNDVKREATIGFAYAAEELIADIVRRNQPFTQILTADYFMCNPYTMTAFGAELLPGEGDGASFAWNGVSTDASLHDANNFKKCRKNNYAHAGILTDFAFMTKYTTTPTNMNRARSRVVQKMFMETDVLSLAQRADLDLDNVIGTVPTLEDPQCTICHETLDPVAGLYKNWSRRGKYTSNKSWPNPDKILDPGYSLTDTIPENEKTRSVQWMANKITSDDRFAVATAKTVFSGITGQETPDDAVFIEFLKNTFKTSGFNLKALVKAVLSSEYYLAANLASSEDPLMFAEKGMAHLLTPEQLHRKILSVTGYAWVSPSSSNRDLLDMNSYRLLYGGINSEEVIERAKEPNGLIAAVQERVAYQSACMAVPIDFDKSQASRLLFPDVEITTSDEATIRQNLQHLHKRVLGEDLAANDAKIDISYQLFIDVRSSTSGTGIPNSCDNGIGNAVKTDSNRTVRPWIAVLAYMLADYRFLFE